MQHERVADAAVIALNNDNGDSRLVAYLVSADADADSASNNKAIKRFLEGKLPSFMIPVFFVWIDALPLTNNGKLNKKALPAPLAQHLVTQEYVAPRNPIEHKLCGIWQQMLNVERIGIDDDFFALGGHSLLATQLVNQIRDSLEVEVPLLVLFEHPSVRGIAERLAEYQAQQTLSGLGVKDENNDEIEHGEL